MHILSMENISKTYGEKVLFKDISLGINEGEKLGLIGVNGTGKSTLLKVMALLDEPDQGKIMVGNRVSIEYLPQNPIFDERATVLEHVFKGSSPVMQLLREYELTLEQLNNSPTDGTLQQKLLALNSQMDRLDAWQLESDAKAVLTKLGISHFDEPLGCLSGGQRKRVALAGALISPADLLILDEPTNHIDNETVAWLEHYLNKRKGALVMITHDRYFLDRVVNRILELDRGNLYSYSGNYSEFLEQKAAREERELASEEKRQNLYRQELAWIRRGAKARTTKQKARIQRFEAIEKEKLELTPDKIDTSGVIASRLGKKVIEIENVSKRLGDRKLIKDFSFMASRHERLGIIGPNGSGKSTLLNLIAGQINPDCGSIRLGETVKIGYFTQENSSMKEEQRVIEYIKEVAEFVPSLDGGLISATKMLERFLFSSAIQWTPIAKLSGGERRRLYLLRLLMEAPNVLLLDEPTNDLDIQTLSILEDYLDEFPGAVIVVSHDRYFLDRVADKLLIFEGNGEITSFVGSYSDYQESLVRQGLDKDPLRDSLGASDRSTSANNPAVSTFSNSTGSTEKQTSSTETPKQKGPKLTFKEQKEFEQIDKLIAATEAALLETSNQINEAGSNYSLLQDLMQKQKNLELQLEQQMDRWLYLNEIVEQSKRK